MAERVQRLFPALEEFRKRFSGLTERVDAIERRSDRYDALLPKPKGSVNTARLNALNLLDGMLNQLFNMDGLEDLYFKTGVDWDNSNGGKASRVRYLIANHLNNETMKRLIAYLRESRPDKQWPDID